MLTLLKSLVVPLLEYCCKLWKSWKSKDIQAMEAIQRTFTYKMTGVQHLNTGKSTRTQILLSPKTQCTLYTVIVYIYICKITQHIEPNINGTMGHKIKIRKHPRHITQCVIQYPSNRNPAQSIQENAITVTVFVGRLCNSLPKYLRDIKSDKTEKLKFELDNF